VNIGRARGKGLHRFSFIYFSIQIAKILEYRIVSRTVFSNFGKVERIKNLNEDRRITIDTRDYQALENSYCIVLLVIK
jgi:hypothetical protein